jgi:hypothetical protein
MKLIIATILLSAVAAAPALADDAAKAPQTVPMCVQLRDIIGTHSDDGKLLTFRMRDGRVLVNHLQGVCSDLRYEGFAWTVYGIEEVCERQQSLRVLRSGQTCVLGKFDVVKDKPAPK